MAGRILFAVLACYWAVAHGAAPKPSAVPNAPDVAKAVIEQARETSPLDCPESIALVVEFEVSSHAYYERRLKRPICPGGASGPTWCIGYDGGHQISHVIRQDWAKHVYVDSLATTAGQVGETACRSSVKSLQHVETEFQYCVEVFEEATFPRYWEATKRAFPGVEALPPCAQGGLFSVVYNRGTAMAGHSRMEMREIRHRCVPGKDTQCIAEQILAMRRLWEGTAIGPGLIRRREAEARLVSDG